MNFADFPSDPFELRAKLFTVNIEERAAESTIFIQQNYRQKKKLYQCLEFMDFVYLDSFRGSFKEWDKHGGFPSIETSHQFDYAIKHALTGSYQAAFGHLRTCLELTLLTVYFSFEKHFMDGEDWLNTPDLDWKKAKQDERKWFDSLIDTPFFSKMLHVLKKDERFAAFDISHQWFDQLKKTYYMLSDHTHIRGYKMGTQAMNNIRAHFNSSSFHQINTQSLSLFLNVLIQSTEQMVVMLALYNPIILVELPLEEKFGINEPIGFIHPGQAELVNNLIPVSFATFFDQLKSSDQEILDIVHWVNTFPAMSEEDIRKQLDDFNSFGPTGKQS
jgi:hypothetical protein